MTIKRIILVASASALALAGCLGSVLDFRNADISSGKIYERGENSPYTGRVTNIPPGRFLGSRPGLQALLQLVGKTVPNEPDRFMDKLLFGAALCDIKVSKGVVDGAASCKVGESDIPKFEMKFSDGQLDGTFKIFDLTDKKDAIVEAKFDAGQLMGTLQMYSPISKKLIDRSTWVNGLREGEEETFFYNTGGRYMVQTYKNGKLNGPVTQYAPDGKTVAWSTQFADGERDGVQESFYLATGKPSALTEWKAGVQVGRIQNWDPSGNLVVNQVIVGGFPRPVDNASGNGAEPLKAGSDGASPAPNLDACVDKWTTAFHKEKGAEAMVAMDQLEEWKSWCTEGKVPQ